MAQQPPHISIFGAGIFVKNTYIPRLAEISNLFVLEPFGVAVRQGKKLLTEVGDIINVHHYEEHLKSIFLQVLGDAALAGVTEELKTFLADTSLATLKKDQSYQVEHYLSFLEGAQDVAVLDATLESWKKQGSTVQVRKF